MNSGFINRGKARGTSGFSYLPLPSYSPFSPFPFSLRFSLFTSPFPPSPSPLSSFSGLTHFSPSSCSNLNGQRYINEVLTPHVLPFLRQMPDHNPVFQDDNARPHGTRIVDDFMYLRANNVNRIKFACHLSRLILHRARLGCAWKSCIGATRQEQHSVRPSMVPVRGLGQNPAADHPKTRFFFKEQSP